MGLLEKTALGGLPQWAPMVGAGVGLVLGLWLLLAAKKRASEWTDGIGAQAVVALGGVAVSVHGLWGFATEMALLPYALAGAFIGVFDAAEMVLLVMLYRSAKTTGRWTPELRLMHRTAWTLVGFSSLMNAVHAPNWWSRPVLAAVPALATWLIELQLRSTLADADEDQEEQRGRPGPVRLLLLVWQHAWARLFAALGLDARAEGDEVARAALARKAAARAYRLRGVLPEDGQTDPVGRRARRRLARRERRAQEALDRADVATDPVQGLAYARRMAGLTGIRRVAGADYSQPQVVLAMLESLAVTPAADRLTASSVVAEAEATAARLLAEAEQSARQRAAEADERAEAARQAEESARQRAAEAEERAEAARQELASARKQSESLVVSARQRAADVSGEERSARQRAEAARHELESARQELEAARQELETARQRAENARNDEKSARQRAADARRAAEGEQHALRELRGEIQEAQRLRAHLGGELADLVPDGPQGAPAWRSDAKQAGWDYYLSAVQRGEEPTAAELAQRHGIDAGNARNWLRDFRQVRAVELAQPRELESAR